MPPAIGSGIVTGEGLFSHWSICFPSPLQQPQKSLQKLTWPSFPLDSEVTNNANHVRRLKLKTIHPRNVCSMNSTTSMFPAL